MLRGDGFGDPGGNLFPADRLRRDRHELAGLRATPHEQEDKIGDPAISVNEKPLRHQ